MPTRLTLVLAWCYIISYQNRHDSYRLLAEMCRQNLSATDILVPVTCHSYTVVTLVSIFLDLLSPDILAAAVHGNFLWTFCSKQCHRVVTSDCFGLRVWWVRMCRSCFWNTNFGYVHNWDTVSNIIISSHLESQFLSCVTRTLCARDVCSHNPVFPYLQSFITTNWKVSSSLRGRAWSE